MKNIVLSALFGLSSTLSGSASATPTLNALATASNIPIQEVHVDQSRMEITVSGELPNPCFSQVLAGLFADDSKPNTLILRVSGFAGQDMCIARVQPFSLVVSVPAAVRESGIKVNTTATYSIRVEGVDFSMQIPGSALVF